MPEASDNTDLSHARTWEALADAAVAASRGDRKRWKARVDELWAEDSWVPSVLAGIMLKTTITRAAGPEPSFEDVSRLARRIQDPYERLVGAGTTTLINLFHTVFDRALTDQEIVGRPLIVHAPAAVGLLLDADPMRELAAMRWEALGYLTRVAPWCEAHWEGPFTSPDDASTGRFRLRALANRLWRAVANGRSDASDR
jgi:hypothetical protein